MTVPTTEPSTPTLTITEIYPSIQGESTWAGLPCVFVRLTGCNLRCTYCDSEFAFYGGTRMTLDAILADVAKHKISLVEVTGGEPLLQPQAPELCRRLQTAGYTVLVETSGERPIEVLPAGVIRIMDLKAPSSGECARNRYENIAHLTPQDEVKFVLGTREDYEWAREKIREYNLGEKCTVLISPVWGKVAAADLVQWMLDDKLKARFQLQLHKMVWDPLARGV
ncbi:MAG TPA: radical SAM protein [Planctomycetota bacterium]|nr:radical SAM protein [Planctomycetota bacterium]